MPSQGKTVSDEWPDQLVIRDLRSAMESGDAFSASRESSLMNMRLSVSSRGDYFDRKSILVFEIDRVEVLSVAICDLPITIGRGERVDRCLDYEGVSRVHCRLERLGGLVRIRDLASKNGTLVNGKPVRVQDLCEGDIIQLGTACFRVRRM